MKLLTLFAILTFSINAFSDCVDDFNNGLNEYNFAVKYFQIGRIKYEKAVDLAGSSSPNIIEICDALVDSVGGFAVSQDSFSNCGGYFNRAVTSCSGDNSNQAGLNRDVCLGNEDIARDNHATVRDVLKDTCFSSQKNSRHTNLKTTHIIEKLGKNSL